LGVDDWSRSCFRLALESAKPLVIDADGLNLLATDSSLSRLSQESVLTPHPGEAARLAGVSVSNIESDRLYWAKSLADQYGSTVILKGAGSVIASHDDGSIPHICSAGNPGMASGGMGDVLAGLVGALMGQGFAASKAALGGVIAHATAGDQAWREHGIGLTATDVTSYLGAILTTDLSDKASR
ncbi:MAG: NAD(P)H-hydrate dehydratase, partial [Halieaceae bacterium]